jgi:ABC-type nitrate/sulfonate/bicarbonate transport system permease component
MKKWANTKHRLAAPAFLLLLLALWEAVCRVAQIREYILPPPSAVWLAFSGSITLLLPHARATLAAAAAGLALAILTALVLALLMDAQPWIKRAVFPLLVVSQTIPIIALAPLFLIFFGYGLSSKVAVVALVCFFPLVVNLAAGLEQVDPEAVDLMKVMRSSPALIIRAVRLPAVLPFFFSGLKIAVTYSVMGAVIGEWLGARLGLGMYMLRSFHSYKTAHSLAAILVVVLLSLALFKLTELAAWAAMPWNRAKINYPEE